MENCNNVSKAGFDPGWNDPPSFSYNAQQTTPNRPRNFLNKRVAFPLAGNSAISPNAAPFPPVILPPVPSVPPIPVQSSTQVTSEGEMDIDSESALIEVKGILLQLLDSSNELGAKANDIKRRISVMEEMWSGRKLNKQVQTQMKELACALKSDQPSKADEIHRALMVDHVSVVGTWMPGVKQLIHHCIARSELLAIEEKE